MQFPSINDVPQVGLPLWEQMLLSQFKEALELLMGIRVSGQHAVTNDAITVQQTDNQSMKQVSATGASVNISGYLVPLLSDYIQLLNNVQSLANDVGRIQTQLNTLISQLEA